MQVVPGAKVLQQGRHLRSGWPLILAITRVRPASRRERRKDPPDGCAPRHGAGRIAREGDPVRRGQLLGRRRALPSAVIVAVAACGTAIAHPAAVAAASAQPCAVRDSGMEVSQTDSRLHYVQANEYNSSAPFVICGNGTPEFDIATSGISVATGGAPGAYPSLYTGCHWGTCTSDSGLPVQVSSLEVPGTVTASYVTKTVSTGAWDDAYDIFYNASPIGTPASSPGLEMMVWLTRHGSVEPAGSVVAGNVAIGGRTYTVWYDGRTVTYVLASPATSMTGLDLGPLAADAVARGYMPASWYLIDIEAGFEIWQGGKGLAASSFSVCTPVGC